MAQPQSHESFQALYADLEAISEPDVPEALLERVAFQLDNLLPDFQGLLDKNVKNPESRQSLATGCTPRLSFSPTRLTYVEGILEVSGEQYNVNAEFQQEALQLAEDLNLDELEAARLYLHSQSETDTTGRSARTISTVFFHQRRRWLLDCLRLVLQNTGDVDQDDILRTGLQEFLDRVVAPPPGSTTNTYIGRCLSSMGDIKSWLQGLADKVNTASVINQGSSEFSETVEFQQASLVTQHELLGVISVYLIKQNHSTLAYFDQLLATLRKVDRYDNLLREHDSLSKYCACGLWSLQPRSSFGLK